MNDTPREADGHQDILLYMFFAGSLVVDQLAYIYFVFVLDKFIFGKQGVHSCMVGGGDLVQSITGYDEMLPVGICFCKRILCIIMIIAKTKLRFMLGK